MNDHAASVERETPEPLLRNSPYDAPCISADEPPVFEVDNADDSGPVVVVCDHASNAVPRSLGSLGLKPEKLEKHVAYDIGAAAMARRLVRLFDAPLLLSSYSRLVIDVNRHPEDQTSIAVMSENLEIPGNRDLAEEEMKRRRAEFFDPYHKVLDEVLESVACRHGVPVLVSVHSFTPAYRGYHRPWHIGILWDRDQRLSQPLIARLSRNPELMVGDNQPYHARDPAGYTMEAHALANGYPHVLLEFRQDLISTDQGQAYWATLISDAVASILAQRSFDSGRHRLGRA